MIDLIEPGLLIEKVAGKLKSIINMPEWAKFVKTGVNRQRPPVSEDWWFVRAAAILRTVENRGPVGVAKLRTKYGGKKNNGMAPEHFRRASGKIIRVILQQLETAKLIKQDTAGGYKGRVITNEGKSLLFSTSKEFTPTVKKSVVKKAESKKAEPKKAEPKKAEVKVEKPKEVPKVEDPKVEVPKVVEKKEEAPIVKKEEPVKEVPKVEASKAEVKTKDESFDHSTKLNKSEVVEKKEDAKAPEKKVE